MGDIISILKHAKEAHHRKAADDVLSSDKVKLDSQSVKERRFSDPGKNVPVKSELKRESVPFASKRGAHIPESDSDPPSPVVEHGRSVFSRLGEMQNDDSETDSKDSVKAMLSKVPPINNKRSGSSSIFERLGPESDKVKKEQEACVTSTTNAGENPISLPRGQ